MDDINNKMRGINWIYIVLSSIILNLFIFNTFYNFLLSINQWLD